MGVYGIANNKGGSTKTTSLIALAIWIACQGTDPKGNKPEMVGMIDMDDHKDLTYRMARFAEIQGDAKLLQRIERNPMGSSVYRLLLSPQDGIQDYAATFDVNEAISLLGQIPRNYDVSPAINPNTIVAETRANYLPHGLAAAPIVLIPGYGSLESLATQLQEKAHGDPSFRMYHVLKKAITITNEKRIQQGLDPINTWLVDFPGSSGFWVKVIGHAADRVIFPLRIGVPYLEGAVSAARDLQTVQDLNNGKPDFIGAIPCQFKPQPQYRMNQWIKQRAIPRLQSVGVSVMDTCIPYDPDIEQAEMSGTLGFEYTPQGPAFTGYKALYQQLKQAGLLR